MDIKLIVKIIFWLFHNGFKPDDPGAFKLTKGVLTFGKSDWPWDYRAGKLNTNKIDYLELDDEDEVETLKKKLQKHLSRRHRKK